MPRLVVALSLLLVAPLAHAARSTSGVPQLVFPPVDADRLLAEDAARNDNGPLRFAEPIEVGITPETDGIWDVEPDGARTWRLRIHVPAATDLNLGFTRFDLPEGASLEILGEEDESVAGPFTRDSATAGQLWTQVLAGDRVLVTLSLPPGAPDPGLELGQIGAGYRDFARDPWERHGPTCFLDVACPEGDPWRDEIDSVAMFSLRGTWKCSGTLVMDVPRTWTPYFLTAAHCNVRDATDAAAVVTYFNYQVTDCAGPRNGQLTQPINGALFRARRADVDVCLLELSERPPTEYNPYWAGWDRTDAPPVETVHIHHPNLDEKEIAFNDDPLTRTDSCIPSGGVDSHWLVNDYELGITEVGSSGSAIWNAGNRRVVGWLTGGTATCSVPDGYDCYGRFAIGWNGASASTRLRDWLDPDGTNASGVDGARPGVVVSPPVGLAEECPGGPGDGNGLVEPGETLRLLIFLTTEGLAEFTSVQGTLTSTTPGVTIPGAVAGWPDLVGGGFFLSNPPHLVAQIDESVPCGTQLDFTLSVTTAERGPFELPFTIDMAPPANCQACSATCLAEEIADVPPDVLRVRKGGPGIVLSYPQTTWCGGAIQVRMAGTARPSLRPGAWPDDPLFVDVSGLDQDAGPDFTFDPPDDDRYFLVVETNADGTPGPSGSY